MYFPAQPFNHSTRSELGDTLTSLGVIEFPGKFSLNKGYIKKIPLNPPFQRGEASGMSWFIEMLRFQFQISSFSQQQRPLLHHYQTAKLLQKPTFPKIKPGS